MPSKGVKVAGHPSQAVWSPDPISTRGTQLSAFIKQFSAASGATFRSYADFERSCIAEFRLFWLSFLRWTGAIVEGDTDPVCTSDSVEQAIFFPGLALNYAENLLDGDDERAAVVSCHAGRPPTLITRGELRRRVQLVAAGMTRLGISPGSRVVAITYNDVEAVVACLATAAVGASFSSAAPEMGARATLSRFAQLMPSVIIAHTESRPGNRLQETLPEIVAGLPSLRCLITLGDAAAKPAVDVSVHSLADLCDPERPLRSWTRFPFNHPLFVLFSSGTTGPPKCIVHGAGGTLLEHLKEHRLHGDLRPGERLFFQTSCAWMMWNWQLSALACRATIVLYDGPISNPTTLWEIVAEHDVSVFGASPAYLKMCESSGLVPRNLYAYRSLRALLSTGSILYDAQYDWVLRDVKPIPIQSISGGTDIVGCFVLGNPNLPVWRGEAQCRSLGLDVQAFGAAPGEIGELICANPFPSRPCGFLGDSSGNRFHEAYFARNPGVWTHGDLIAIADRGSVRLHGRFDGVLNVRGIRVGPAEIYAALQDVTELSDLAAVEQSAGLPEPRVVLLVVLKSETALTDELVLRIRREITSHAGASHVPAVIADVQELPLTHSGKLSESAIRHAVNGLAVPNTDSLRNPGCLAAIASHPALRPGSRPTISIASGHHTEMVLQQIWASIFGVTSVDVGEDFFDLGGDSLLAVSMCVHIEEAFGYRVPISVLFQAPTITKLADLLDRGLVWQGDSPIVVLQEGCGAPIFLLHSVTGNVFEWRALLRHLRSDRPIYAIQARGLNPAETPLESVETMAADYVTLIREREPQGPYSLFGYSFGGLLAYEVAVRLQRMGETVELVGMLDSVLHERGLPLRERFGFWCRRLRHLGGRTRAFGVAGMLHHARRIRRSHRDRVESAARAIDGVELPPVLHRVRLACHRASAAYNPPAYAGVVSYFRSRQRQPEFCDPLVILRRRAKVHVIDVPGSHISMMHDPDVAFVAVEMSRVIGNSAPNRPADHAAIGAGHSPQDLPPRLRRAEAGE